MISTFYQKVTLVIAGMLLLTLFFSLLPDASDYPFPQEEMNLGLGTLVLWMTAFNGVLPVDTFFEVLWWGIIYKFTVAYIYPLAMWLFAKGIRLVGG